MRHAHYLDSFSNMAVGHTVDSRDSACRLNRTIAAMAMGMPNWVVMPRNIPCRSCRIFSFLRNASIVSQHISKAYERTEHEGEDALKNVGDVRSNARKIRVADTSSKSADVLVGGYGGGDVGQALVGLDDNIVNGRNIIYYHVR